MRKRVIGSIILSSIVAGVLFSGCGGSNNPSPITKPNKQEDKVDSAMIQIETANGSRQSVDPVKGGTVTIARNNDGTKNVAAVVHGELNKCTDVTSDDDEDGVVCGPKKGIKYVFQADFGKLGGSDINGNPADGGFLLFDALTYYNDAKYETPVDGNKSENRIQEVYIPSNYITLTDELKNASVDAQYDAMREYLADLCNMQCLVDENANNPYFSDTKKEGEFVATYAMWFTRGTGEAALKEKFESGDYSDLEYLAVEFPLTIEQVDNNSSKLRFTVPKDAQVIFRGKKHGKSAKSVTTTNDVIDSVLHESQDYVDPNFTINMAKYFDKLIEKGEAGDVAEFAKEILVENAQHPWPVKIYGTLHEKKDDGSYDRAFIRNPGKFYADWFNMTEDSSPYAGAYKADSATDDNRPRQAIKFNIVYPGGDYNKL